MRRVKDGRPAARPVDRHPAPCESFDTLSPGTPFD